MKSLCSKSVLAACLRCVLSLCFTLLLSFQAKAQDPLTPEDLAHGLVPVIPPAPNAASLGKYGEFPVGLYTGTPSITIPIYQINGKKISLPISLSYHASGIRVDEIASWVGLGWSLKSGGSISRTVRGKPDEQSNGYLSPTVCNYSQMPLHVLEQDNNFLQHAAAGTFDTHPDLFTFSFGGRSGKVYFDCNSNIGHVVPYQNLKIEHFNHMQDFQITDENGTKYFFSTKDTTISDGGSGGPLNIFTSAWHLSEIRSSDDTEIVTFEYEGEDLNYGHKLGERMMVGSGLSGCGGPSGPQHLVTQSQMIVRAKRLSRIVSEHSTVEFLAHTARPPSDLDGGYRLDEIKVFNPQGVLIQHTKLNYQYDSRLHLTEVFEESINGGDPLPGYKLYYNPTQLPARDSHDKDHWGYYNAANNTSSIPLIDLGYRVLGFADKTPNDSAMQAEILQKIVFPTGGHTEFEFEPHDYGYFNQHEEEEYVLTGLKDSITVDISIPLAPTSDTFHFHLNHDQYVRVEYDCHNPNLINDGLSEVFLKTLTGVTIADYFAGEIGDELLHLPAGSYFVEAKGLMPGDFAFCKVEYTSESTQPVFRKMGSGLRIKTLRTHDGIDAANDMVKCYEYRMEEDTSRSSGVLGSRPIYTDTERIWIQKVSPNGGGSSNTIEVPCGQMTISSNSNISPVFSQGNAIVYREVRELHGANAENGYKRSKYTSFYEYKDLGGHHRSNGYGSSRDFMRGLTKEEAIYTADDEIRERVTHHYTFENQDNYSTVEGFNIAYLEQHKMFPQFDSITIEPYSLISQWFYTHETTTETFDEYGNKLTKSGQFFYDNPDHIQLTRSQQSNSDGTVITQVMKYPQDYKLLHIQPTSNTASQALKKMDELHIHAPVIERQIWEGDPSDQNAIVLNAEYLSYEHIGANQIQIAHSYTLDNKKGVHNFQDSKIHTGSGDFKVDQRYRPVLHVDEVDTDGNILEFHREADIPNAFLYGHDGLVPIAEVKNASQEEIAYTGFEAGSYGNWALGTTATIATGTAFTGQNSFHSGSVSKSVPPGKYSLNFWHKGFSGTISINNGQQTFAIVSSPDWESQAISFEIPIGLGFVEISGNGFLDDLRLLPEEAAMTTVTYNERLGIAALSDLNNKPAFFEYDDFGRLKLIRDFEQNILQAFTYQMENTGSIEGKNYVLTEVFKSKIQSLSDSVGLYGDHDLIRSYQYVDGLGRTVQQIAVKAGPAFEDLVSMVDFDGFGRSPVQYLPFSIKNNHGAYRSNALAAQAIYWNSNHFEIPQADRLAPYSKVLFEASPTQTILESGAPGKDWQPANGHTKKIRSRVNDPIAFGVDNVRMWEFHLGNGNFSTQLHYPPGTLDVFETEDEDGHIKISYKDKFGRLILIRTAVDQNTSHNNPVSWSNVYYLYNELGQLIHVIQPEGVKQLQDNTLAAWDLYWGDLLKSFVFSYQYDVRGRLIAKRVPGSDWHYTVYDLLDRPVATQGGKLRLEGKWAFKKYDALGRTVVTGFVPVDTVLYPDRGALQQWVSAQQTQELNVPGSGLTMFESRENGNLNTPGYSHSTFPDTNAVEIHTITWYDDYDFNEDGTADETFALEQKIPNAISKQSSFTKGMMTGKEDKIIDPEPGMPGQLRSVTFYDKNGKELQIQMDNHRGGKDIITNSYQFPSQLKKTVHRHTAMELGQLRETVIQNRFLYDHTDRLTEIRQKNNNDPWVVVSQSKFDDLGKEIEKNLHSTNKGAHFLQSLDYTYNIRGWLRQINRPDYTCSNNSNSGSGGQGNNGSTFTLKLSGINIFLKGTVIDNTPLMKIRFEDQKMIYTQLSGETSAEEDSASFVVNKLMPLSQSCNVDDTLEIHFPQVIVQEGQYANIQAQIASQLDQEVAARILPSELIQLKDLINTVLIKEIDGLLQEEDDHDLAALELRYNEGFSSLNGTPLYNGNISGLIWQGATDCEPKGYGFTYDHQDRLKTANYASYNAGLWNGEKDRYSVNNLTYDLNGNILTLNRKGVHHFNNQQFSYGMMDQLAYQYIGNQLIGVNDAALSSASLEQFLDQVPGSANKTDATTHEYQYDIDGNLIRDEHKGATITYNHQLKPIAVVFDSGKEIRFTYDANGEKLRERIIFGGNTPDKIRDYIGGFLYEDEALLHFAHSEGRVVALPTGSATEFRYEYFFKDHLGNVRLTFTDLDDDQVADVVQEDAYYPFGMRMGGVSYLNGTENRYLYNGKELHGELGLYWYDYGFRWSMQDLGRFVSVDPLAEKFYYLTTYQYASNTPIWAIDLDGLEGAKVKDLPKVPWGPKISASAAKKNQGTLKQDNPSMLENWRFSVETKEASLVSSIAYNSANDLWVGAQDLTPGIDTPKNLGGGEVSASERQDGAAGALTTMMGMVGKAAAWLNQTIKGTTAGASLADDMVETMGKQGDEALEAGSKKLEPLPVKMPGGISKSSMMSKIDDVWKRFENIGSSTKDKDLAREIIQMQSRTSLFRESVDDGVMHADDIATEYNRLLKALRDFAHEARSIK